MKSCPLCSKRTDRAHLAEAGWISPETEAELLRDHPNWKRSDGACPACVQHYLLQVLLRKGEAALHAGVQTVWPLDAEAAFGAIPTPLRLHADPRFTGKGVTIAMVDSAFYPHPDLTQPANRIRGWVDASAEGVQAIEFATNDTPQWSRWDSDDGAQWHGTMTTVAAAGNGWLSHGLYRGLASDTQLVLVQVMNSNGKITNTSIVRALSWILENHQRLDIRIVNLSLGGDPVENLRDNPIDRLVEQLVRKGIVVVVAAGNDGVRRLVPPGSSPAALTIGGLDDQNTFDHEAVRLWHSNYGQAANGTFKPELVAPSIWVVAPVLPTSRLAQEAKQLFNRRARGDASVEARIAELKLVTPHYQHVDGTSFAAPLTTSVVAGMLEANPLLTTLLTKEMLTNSAQPIAAVPREQQGAGVLHAGKAVALAKNEQHDGIKRQMISPLLTDNNVRFLYHDHEAHEVRLMGSWNDWQPPGATAIQLEPGLWQIEIPRPAAGVYVYKFLIDNHRWVDDLANPEKIQDGFGGLNSLLIIP